MNKFLARAAVFCAVLCLEPRASRADSGGQPPWEPYTSGPFLAGDAEVVPMGTWWLRPLTYFQNLGDGKYEAINTENVGVGLGNRLAFNASVPLVPYQTQNYFQEQQYWFKWEFMHDRDTYHIAGQSYGVEARFVDQTDADKEGVFFLSHDRFKSLQFYAQLGAFSPNPVTNAGQPQSINGVIFNYDLSLEHILNDSMNAGYILEAFGQNQSNYSFYGTTNAPGWGYLSIAPEFEFDWPNKKSFAIAWQAGVFLPVYAHNYVYGLMPVLSMIYHFNWGDD
jgi:hypothetical protein